MGIVLVADVLSNDRAGRHLVSREWVILRCSPAEAERVSWQPMAIPDTELESWMRTHVFK